MTRRLSYLILLLFCGACSQFSNAPTSKAWHNMNAKYNAIYDAEQNYDFGLFKIDSTRIDDYSSTLPILVKIDSNNTAVSKAELDEVIRLTSLIAEKHSNSKHLDQAYLLLGKSRYFKEDFINAIEVFKYVNTKYKKIDHKHNALIWLMKSYMEQNSMTEALEIAAQLDQLSMNKANKAEYFEAKAALYQRSNEKALSVVYLEEAIKHQKKGLHKARNHFIAGQLYRSLGKGSLARSNWKSVIKNRPDYDLEFNTGIELLMLSADLGVNANATFKKMLEDRKNVDLKDKIYFKMAEVKAEQGQYTQAVSDYTSSIKLANDKTQKASAYQRIAELYYGPLEDYLKSANYFDSTLQNLNTRSPGYDEIAEKAKSLKSFVAYNKVIITEDSLQKLAEMNPLELSENLDEMLATQAANEKRISDEAKKLEEEQNNRAQGGGSPSGAWLFYDQVSLTRSRAEFIRVWGNRALEDNWRRKEKELGSISFKIEKGIETTEEVDQAKQKAIEEAKRMADLESKKAALLANIPNTPEKLAASRKKQEEAYYELGKIYKLQFNQNNKAKESFLKLLEKFPKTSHEPEVLYFLALMENDGNSGPYRETLIFKYPLSNYARQLSRGNVVVSAATEDNAEKKYEEVFEAYSHKEFDKALQLSEDGLRLFSGTKVEDKLAMIRILCLSKKGNLNAYRIALLDFTKSYPGSNLKPQVNEMLSVLSK